MDAPITPTAPSIGLALSGGGVRATLFALGALIAIVDSGQNRRVSEITSVSGGSITNAFVAQRCDFSNVGPAEFDQIAGSLIRRVTTGLVPRRLVAALYGLSGLLIASVVALSWPLSLAWPFDLLLCFCYGLALLLRGIVLARLLGAKLFSDAALPHTLRQQQGQVNHVFCTTDLNSTLPVYLCTRKPFFFSPVWGSARSDQAGDLDFTTAVRASAAFPGGIPPRRLRLRKLDVRPGAQAWTARLGRLRFRDVSPDEVRALYLSDGGVWNNLGTDWYLPETRAQVVTSAAFGPESSALIVVDATPPPPATENLWYLRFPWLAELLTIARVLNVLYVSTVVTRIAELERKRQEASDSTGHDRVVRMVDPLRVARNAAVCWKGRDTWSGRRGWFGRTGSLTERLVHPAAGVEREGSHHSVPDSPGDRLPTGPARISGHLVSL